MNKELLQWCEGKTLEEIYDYIKSQISYKEWTEIPGKNLEKAKYLYNKVNRSKTMTKEEALKKIEELKQFIEQEEQNNKPIELVKYISSQDIKNTFTTIRQLEGCKPTLLLKDYDGYDLILLKGNWCDMLYLGHWNSGKTE